MHFRIARHSLVPRVLSLATRKYSGGGDPLSISYSFLSEINIYDGASVTTVLKLFDSLVSPILLYHFLISVGN